jgi:hypothetical protein
MHPDQDRRVAAGRERTRVLRPLVLHDPLAARVEVLGQQRVERQVAARAVAVHHDHLDGAGVERAPHRRVDLLRVEAAPLLVQRAVMAHLRPPADAGDALHVGEHVDAHRRERIRSAAMSDVTILHNPY